MDENLGYYHNMVARAGVLANGTGGGQPVDGYGAPPAVANVSAVGTESEWMLVKFKIASSGILS